MEGARSLDLPFILLLLTNIGILIYLLGIRLGVWQLIYFFLGIAVTVFFLIMFVYKPVYLARDLNELYPFVSNYLGNKWGKPFKEDGKTVIRVGILPPRYIVFAHGSYEAPFVIETPWYDFLLGRIERVLEYGKFGPFRWAKKLLFVPLIPERTSYIELKLYSVKETDQGYALSKYERSETEFSLISSLMYKSDYIFIAPATVEVDEKGNKNIIFTAPPIVAKPKLHTTTVDMKTMYTISSTISRLSLTYYELLEEQQKRLQELVTTIRDIAIKDVQTIAVLSELFRSAMRDLRVRETQKVAFESVVDRLRTVLMTTDAAEVTKQAVAQLLQQFYDSLAKVEGQGAESVIEATKKLDELLKRIEMIEQKVLRGEKNEQESSEGSERRSAESD